MHVRITQRVKLAYKFYFPILLLFHVHEIHTYSSWTTSKKVFTQQTTTFNIFTGCNIHVIAFRGLAIDFEVIKIPIILLRYFSYCKQNQLFPIELLSANSRRNMYILSTCRSMKTDKTKLLAAKIANKFVSQTLPESFQLTSKNQNCEANIYLHPQTEQLSSLMYSTNLD